MKKRIFMFLSVIVGFLCTVALKNQLSSDAGIALGVLAGSIVLWISGTLPDYVTALLMAVCFILFSDVPSEIVLGAFSKPSLWLLLTAFGLSLCMSKCGLLNRIAGYLLRLFPNSFMGRVLGLTAAGLVSAPFVPSMSAKAAVFSPLAMKISDAAGYKRKSKEASGLFLAMLIAIRSPGPLFISASVNGYTLSGLLPQPFKDQFTMSRWFTSALPWYIIVLILSIFTLWILYRPKSSDTEEKGNVESPILPMSRKEKKMVFIISATMLLWMTESIHGIPAYIVSLTALCACLGCGIISSKEFCSEMNWTAVLFIGVVLEIASVFKYLGINQWFIDRFSSVFAFFADKPYLFIFAVALSTILLRFVIVSEVALINIYMVFLIPFSMEIGINPWVVGFALYAVVCPWFFLYQSPVYMAAYYACNGEMIKPSQASLGSALYMLICILSLLLCVKYWDWIGILYI